MAVENTGTIQVQPTGAFPDPPATVTYEQVAHNTPTGAVEGPDKPVIVEFGAMGQDPTGVADVPESVTVTVPGFKVVNPPRRREAGQGASTAEVEPSDAERAQAQADAESRRARRAAADAAVAEAAAAAQQDGGR